MVLEFGLLLSKVPSFGLHASRLGKEHTCHNSGLQGQHEVVQYGYKQAGYMQFFAHHVVEHTLNMNLPSVLGLLVALIILAISVPRGGK